MKTFLVGGAVRDDLLGRSVKDHDWVVVGSTPREMLDAGFEQVGAEFPVFLHPDTKEEYALARQERKTGPGYHGFETRFDPSITLEDDLVRRDLTINAMARDSETNELIDPHNGLADLHAGVLRHVSDAFAEDPLRVLRVARFAARYNFSVAPETIELMRRLVTAGELDHLTSERVWNETERALMEDNPMEFFWVLDKCGAKDVLFPELGRTLIFSGAALRRAALRNATLETRVMLLFAHVTDNDAFQMLERLKAPSWAWRLTRKFLHFFGALRTEAFTPENILRVMKDIDGLRRPNDMFEVATVVDFYAKGKIMERLDTFLAAFKRVQNVTFATLTEEQKGTLMGPDIGLALDETRLEKIKEVM